MPSVRVTGIEALGHRTYLGYLEAHLRSRPEFGGVHVDRVAPGPALRLFTNRYWVVGSHRSRTIRFYRCRHALLSPVRARCDIELFHTQNVAGGALDSRAAVVVSIDTTGVLTERMTGRRHDGAMFKLEQAILRRADLVAAMSRWAAESAAADYGVLPSNILVVRNGVLPTEARAHVGGGGWLFVGGEFRRKGGDLLLGVHQERFRSVPLVVVTSRREAGQIKGENVRVHHDVSRGRLLEEFYPRADLFVLPSREDYSPWVIPEALWSGVPVVAARVGAIPEMLREGLDGWMLDRVDRGRLAETLGTAREALRDPAAARRMSRSARQRAEEMLDVGRNLDALCDRLLEIAPGRGEAGRGG